MLPMEEEVPSPELIQFHALLENAFPEHSVVVQPLESAESYLNEVRNLNFNGQDWRLVEFPEDESDAIAPAFDLLDNEAKKYYIAAYMRESVVDPYYQPGCLMHLKSFAREGGMLSQMTPYQRESVVWYCEQVEEQINELGMMDRIGRGVDLVTVKWLKGLIRNTVW